MNNKFEIGDLVTSTLLYGLGIVIARIHQPTHPPVWVYRAYYSNGKLCWQPESQFTLIAKANK